MSFANRKKLLFTVVFLSLCFTFIIITPLARATIFDDIVTGAKNFVLGGEKKELTIDSNIELAPDGDKNSDGKIDSGDIIRFNYKISNTTINEYAFGTLKTNIDRKKINFIHNVRAVSLNDKKDIIVFPNLRLRPGQTTEVGFDARVTYSSEEDISINTEAEYIDKEKNTVAKATRKEVKALKLDKEKLNSLLKATIKQK